MARVPSIRVIGIGMLALLYVHCHHDRLPEGGQVAGPAVRRLLAELRSKSEEQLFDFHGNACPQLQELIAARFPASEAIMSALDAQQGYSSFTHALLLALGFSKDPATIGWLRVKMRTPAMANLVYGRWIPVWETRLSGAIHSQLKWLEGKALWRQFFTEQFQVETDENRRLRLLRIIVGWFHDTETKDFLAEVGRSPSLGPRELVLVQMYFSQHDQSIETKRLREAINQLNAAREDRFLLEVSREFLHEAFIPYLISAVEKYPNDANQDQEFDPEDLLRRTTLALDVSGAANWQDWYREHQSGNRATWIEQAVTRLVQMRERDDGNAVQSFKRAIYFWADPSFLPHMNKFVRFGSFANSVIGWINLSYRPYARDKFYNLAVLILQTHGSELTNKSKEFLRELEFLEGQRESWKQYVVRMNSSV